MVEVHCGELSMMELIKSSQAVWSVIFGPGPERAYCSCLTTYRLLFAPSELWQEGFQEQLWSVSCLSFSISHPRSRESFLRPGWTGSWMEGLMAMEQSAQCGRADVWVLADILWCVPHVSPLTLSSPNLCSLYSFISLIWPHNSIKKSRWDHS